MKRSDTKPLGCGICPYKTNSACHLERHLRIHTGDKPYACNMCSYKATDGGLLKRHMRIHSGEKPFTCQICGHKTAQSCSLKDHMAVHTGKKRYACDICPFQCSRIGRLRDHQLQHKTVCVKKEVSSEEPDHPELNAESQSSSIKCPQCGLEFPGVPNLNRHIATAHKASNELPHFASHGTTTDLQYNCSLCSASADSLETLNNHFTQHILYRCLECDLKFETPAELVAHGPEHSEELIFNCNKCDFKSKTRNELRGHERTHNSSQCLICAECDFVSKSNTEFAQHLKTHTSTEMVQCNICCTKFGKTAELRAHMGVHYSRSRPRMTRKPTIITPELSSAESFHCYYCSYKSSEENQMARHIRGHITPSVPSEKYTKDCHEQHATNTYNEEPNCASDAQSIPQKVVQIDAGTKSNSSHASQTPKMLEFNHCPCNFLGFRWLKNPECNFQSLTHFMNPNTADFSAGLAPFHCGKCRVFLMHDGDLQTKVSIDKQETGERLLSVGHDDNDTQRLPETGVDDYKPKEELAHSGCREIFATGRSPNNLDIGSIKRSSDVIKQTNVTNREPEQTVTEPNIKKIKKEVQPSPIHGTCYFENEEEKSKSRCLLTSDEEKSKSAAILLSKLRQFFSESFPKLSPPEAEGEEDSDQSTLTAHSSTRDILTIEISSDSNASDHEI